MRQTISALAAMLGLAVVGTAPATACGGTPCAPCGYASPCAPTYGYQPTYGYSYSGAAAYERLPEPTRQYYYVNQGPTYTGPGNFAPYPSYQESAVPVYPRYGYDEEAGVSGPPAYGYRWHHHPRPTTRDGYRHSAYRWGYAPYYHGQRVLRRYY